MNRSYNLGIAKLIFNDIFVDFKIYTMFHVESRGKCFYGKTNCSQKFCIEIPSNINRSQMRHTHIVKFVLLNVYRELRSTGSRRVSGSFHFESPFSIGGNIYRYLRLFRQVCARVP